MKPRHLSLKAGVSAGYISEILNGKKGIDPTLSVIRRIARGFGMSATAFIKYMEKLARVQNKESSYGRENGQHA